MEAVTNLPTLTEEQENTLIDLTNQVNQYIHNEPLTAVEVDNGFYYDYGSISGAWHSEPDVEFTEGWGEIELDVGEVEDYIFDHLVEWASEEHSNVYYNLREEYDDTACHIKVSWYWDKSNGKVFLCCNIG